MSPTRLGTRATVATAIALLCTAAAGTANADETPAPAPAVATCSSANPMFVVGSEMLNWQVIATPLSPGIVEFRGTGTAGARDVILRSFDSEATLSWNNTSTGDYGSTELRGSGGLPTLDRVTVDTGTGDVTYNVVIKSGAGTRWIGTQVSTPCVGTVAA